MKKILSQAILGLTLVSASCAWATTTTTTASAKIGVVNYMAVFQQVPQGKPTLEKLKAQLAPQLQKLQTQQQALASSIESLERNAPTMTAQVRQTQEAALTKQQQDFQQQVMNLKSAEMKKEESAANNFETDLNNAIAKVAKAGQYDLVLNDQAAPYYSSSFDITSSVISAMQQMPS